MCIKIVRSHEEVEFEPAELLEAQVRGAKQVIINYEPDNEQIRSFMEQMERIVKTGVGCQMNIKVNSNHSLSSYKFERQIDKKINDLDLNKAIKQLVENQLDLDNRLLEMKQLCLGKN